ncbi:hypothetical protein BV898_07472 [Hypsibius exemplaris]|uniref:Transmembrane protein 230 n=1 Tax=Hypsibius exemplaris TaxID=2072580 RepID=A0A1W0WTJ0_HYPEX|nr:hypothetical protein BV898_07472 [Hypsibius exemplaris]
MYEKDSEFLVPEDPRFESLRKRDVPVKAQRSKSSDEFTEGQYTSQFYDVCTPPIASIIRAVLLFVVGTVLTVIGSLLLAGYFDVAYADRTWPVLTLGLICFIPGFHYSRIAYYVHKGYPGYSYTDIPDNLITMKAKAVTADFVQAGGDASDLRVSIPVSPQDDLTSLGAALMDLKERINTHLTGVIKNTPIIAAVPMESAPSEEEDFEEEEEDYLADLTKDSL